MPVLYSLVFSFSVSTIELVVPSGAYNLRLYIMSPLENGTMNVLSNSAHQNYNQEFSVIILHYVHAACLGPLSTQLLSNRLEILDIDEEVDLQMKD